MVPVYIFSHVSVCVCKRVRGGLVIMLYMKVCNCFHVSDFTCRERTDMFGEDVFDRASI